MPLFCQIQQIKQRFKIILVSSFLGVIITISTCISIALLLTDDKVLLLSLLPKPVTSPIAMAIANEIGGLASLAAAVVIAVGLLGALGGFSYQRYFNSRFSTFVVWFITIMTTV